MASLWTAWPVGADPARLSREVSVAYERFLSGGEPTGAIRPIVADSWRRCINRGVDPDGVDPPVELSDDTLSEYRRAHALAPVFPIIEQLLVDDVTDSGLVVTITDADGRLLWLDGDARQRARAETLSFVEGANWGERTAGTNAIGTALATGQPVQVFSAEHFRRKVHTWSCTAAPIRDPDTGVIIGMLDVSGGTDAASPQMLTVVRASVAAAEAELRVRRLTGAEVGACGDDEAEGGHGRLEVLGRDQGHLSGYGCSLELSPRHSELLFLLHRYPAGLCAEELATALHYRECSPITIRAELARLRRNLGPDLIQSRPYRLREPLATDVDDLRRLLDEGAHVRALDLYRGPLLPRSRAPKIIEIREEIRWAVRGALLGHASGDDLFRYAQHPDSLDDQEIWQACRDRLPVGSPRRTRAASHLQHLNHILG